MQKQKVEEGKLEEKEPKLKLKVSNQTLQKKPVQPKVVEEVVWCFLTDYFSFSLLLQLLCLLKTRRTLKMQ